MENKCIHLSEEYGFGGEFIQFDCAIYGINFDCYKCDKFEPILIKEAE